MDWYKHDIGAYKRKTHGLSALEDGIYRRLLDEYYASGGALPDDPLTLRSLARIRTKWEVKAMSTVIDKFFPVNGDGYRHNKRADEEIYDYLKICETNRQNRKGRVVNEPSTDGQRSVPPSKGTNQLTNNDACGFVLQNGQKCSKPSIGRTNQQWHCREHGPYAK